MIHACGVKVMRLRGYGGWAAALRQLQQLRDEGFIAQII